MRTGEEIEMQTISNKAIGEIQGPTTLVIFIQSRP